MPDDGPGNDSMHVLAAYMNQPAGAPIYKRKDSKSPANLQAPNMIKDGKLVHGDTENTCDTKVILYHTSENRQKRKEQNELNNPENAQVIDNDQINSASKG